MSKQTSAGSAFSKESIIDDHTLSFDPGDRLNGSLYIGTSRDDAGGVGPAQVIEELRKAGLWSSVDPKEVLDDQRAAYKEQLDFVEAIPYQGDGGAFLVARFDHPKYPSDEERWRAWQACLDAVYSRVEGTA